MKENWPILLESLEKKLLGLLPSRLEGVRMYEKLVNNRIQTYPHIELIYSEINRNVNVIIFCGFAECDTATLAGRFLRLENDLKVLTLYMMDNIDNMHRESSCIDRQNSTRMGLINMFQDDLSNEGDIQAYKFQLREIRKVIEGFCIVLEKRKHDFESNDWRIGAADQMIESLLRLKDFIGEYLAREPEVVHGFGCTIL